MNKIIKRLSLDFMGILFKIIRDIIIIKKPN